MNTVKCSNYGVETNTQPEGDGCHSCSRGSMRKVDNTDDSRKAKKYDSLLEQVKFLAGAVQRNEMHCPDEVRDALDSFKKWVLRNG